MFRPEESGGKPLVLDDFKLFSQTEKVYVNRRRNEARKKGTLSGLSSRKGSTLELHRLS